MVLGDIWRYPVKSMAGESLQSAMIGTDGVEGDRIIHVEAADGSVVTSRSRPRLLRHRAVLSDSGTVVVDGRPWGDGSVAHEVEEAAGAGARLVPWRGLERFDVLPLSVATDGAIEFLGADVRRFRPNLVLAGVPGLSEREWEGRLIRIGELEIRAVSLRRRCVMITFDPDTGARDPALLARVHRELGGRLSLDCEVLRPGLVSVGATAELG